MLECIQHNLRINDCTTFVIQFMEQVLMGEESVMYIDNILIWRLLYACRIISDALARKEVQEDE